jgi:acetolactate synthase-1/2/3 large subunit
VSASQADMGCALPASIGVALANPNKKILCITGDGSFNSNLQELAVIKYHNLPIKIFVLDNKGYLSIRNTQQKFFDGRVYGTSDSKGLWFPSIDKVAETYDMNWIALKDLNCDLTEIVNTDTPTIVQVFCSFNQEVIPTQALKQQGDKQVQAPLEDMYPFMSEETFRKEKLRALQGVPWEQ